MKAVGHDSQSTDFGSGSAGTAWAVDNTPDDMAPGLMAKTAKTAKIAKVASQV